MWYYNFDGVHIELMLTGSAVFGFHVPKDIDYIGRYTQDVHNLLISNGWLTGTNINDSSDPGDGFVSYKKGHVNLILAVTEEFFQRWMMAHNFILNNPGWGSDKVKRVIVFRHFLYDEYYQDITKLSI